jgi:uncharacterized membrane protein (DUF373 family)
MWPSLKHLFGHDRIYDTFERVVMSILTLLLILMIAFATWHLIEAIVLLLFSGELDPTDPRIYPNIFSLIFTILIGFEFKHSFLSSTATQTSVIRIRSIILIGMLATVRKVIILDLKQTDVPETLAVAASVLALGIVYWLVKDPDHDKPKTIVPTQS